MKNRKKAYINLSVFLSIILAIAVFKYFTRDIWDVNAARLKADILAIKETTDTIKLNELTSFEWDTLYSFSPYTSKDIIYEVVGYRWDNITEMLTESGQQLVFLKDGKVVCYISELTSKSGFYLSLKYKSNIYDIPMTTSEEALDFKVDRIGDITYLHQL